MILIDIPIPKNCLVCPMCNEYLMCAIPCNGKGWGETDVHEYDHNRPEWCPIKDVVMCKDCIKRCLSDCPVHLGGSSEYETDDDWFCADGRRRDE